MKDGSQMSRTSEKVLLELLKHHNEWISGNQMAAEIAVTRETIWKNINLLKKQGHVIESQKNLGYKYENSQKLDETVVNYYKDDTISHIMVESTVDSTQMYAKNYLATHPIDQPVAIFAEQQTQGYGRRGREFYSPKEQGLYFSVVIPHPKYQMDQIGLIMTGVALVIAQELKQFFPDRDFSLKWVNDILLNGRKVSGIITEAITELEYVSTQALVIGVGINLTTVEFPPELKNKATAIKPDQVIDRNRLAARLVATVIEHWEDYLDGSLLPAYRAMSAVIGRQVTLVVGNQTVKGIAQDINEQGNLVVKTDDGQLHAFNNGEITKVNLD
jgi:BirA family biotin operon repressor/biotin-[acetyl-CoA-carboxylase] ligase